MRKQKSKNGVNKCVLSRFIMDRLYLPWKKGAFLATVLLSLHAHGFYLPGAAPKDYQEGEKVEVFVNHLNPVIAADSTLVSLFRIEQSALH
jgi:hypothetical protein